MTMSHHPDGNSVEAAAATALRDALLWTVGNDASRIRLNPNQYEIFLDAVSLHRLTGRLVKRLRSDWPAAPRQLVSEAVRIHDGVLSETYKKVALADRLGTAMREAGSDDYVVLLKGFTLYALTGDPLTVRWSGDLDLCVSDLDGFVEVAARLGFRLARPLNHLAEYAVLHSPVDGWVELHSRFDVTSVPASLTRADVAPGLHPGVWEQRQRFCVRYLRHDDFQKNLAVSSVTPESVRPLRPELAALVCASHMYKNFLRYPYPAPIATIPLDEIATFVDLCRMPWFDAARFAGLIDEFNGTTAVSFARALAKDLVGADPLPGSRDEVRLFPQNLWWDGLDDGGFPVDLGWDPKQLVYRDQQICEIVNTFGPVEISELDSGSAFSFTLLDLGQTTNATRYVFRKEPQSQFAADFTVSADARGLRIRISLPRVRDDRMVGITMHWQDHRYEMFLNCTARESFTDYSMKRDAGREVTTERWMASQTEGVEITLPPGVVEDCETDGFMSGFIVVREQAQGWARITAGAAVPLRIRIPQPSRLGTVADF